MKNLEFTLIDFSSIEPKENLSNFESDSREYKHMKHYLEGLEDINNFELWFDNLLSINQKFLFDELTKEECIDLGLRLKKVEESNKELQEFVKTWREDENMSDVQKFMMTNVLIGFYEGTIWSMYDGDKPNFDNSVIASWKVSAELCVPELLYSSLSAAILELSFIISFDVTSTINKSF